MKFKYYITDLIAGKVVGTNDDTVAGDCSHSEDFFVVNAETGEWIIDGLPQEITE